MTLTNRGGLKIPCAEKSVSDTYKPHMTDRIEALRIVTTADTARRNNESL